MTRLLASVARGRSAFAPKCAASLVALSWVVTGCGGDAESSGNRAAGPPDAVTVPTAVELWGDWYNDYITAGAVSRRSRLAFAPGGSITTRDSSMTNFVDPPLVREREGKYFVTERGVVTVDWGGDGDVDSEDSLVVVDGRALDGTHPCCRLLGGATRWWTFRGYLAEDARRTSFRRRSLRAVADESSGSVLLRVATDVTLSAAPAELARAAACSLRVTIAAEASTLDGSSIDEARFDVAFDCAVREESSGFLVILVAGRDSVDGEPLERSPSRAPSVWRSVLAEYPEVEGLRPIFQTAIESAFEPYLVADLERPNLLFHALADNSPAPTGYARAD